MKHDLWSVGIDPGLRCTAVVLLKNDVPIAAISESNVTTYRPIQYRVHDMALTVRNTIQGWINQYNMPELRVMIELPILNRNKGISGIYGKKCGVCGRSGSNAMIGITTMLKQMRMITVYQEMLFQLEGAKILLGEVNPTTAKRVFTGKGNASKAAMIAHSVWKGRPDVADREHLADAQAIGTVIAAVSVDMGSEDRVPNVCRYEDGAIGTGPQWAGYVPMRPDPRRV